MGMSASQARLIALTARMSDVEYEGQQINQQRLTLTNKMSEVYEQMVNMDVPTPPSKIDFAVEAYSGKVGKQKVNVRMNDNGSFTATKTETGWSCNTGSDRLSTDGEDLDQYVIKGEQPLDKGTLTAYDPTKYEETVSEEDGVTEAWDGFGNGSDDQAMCSGTYKVKYNETVAHKASDLKPGSQTETWGSDGTHEELCEDTITIEGSRAMSDIGADVLANTKYTDKSAEIDYTGTTVKYVGTRTATSFVNEKVYFAKDGSEDISGADAIAHNTKAETLANKKVALVTNNGYRVVNASDIEDGQEFYEIIEGNEAKLEAAAVKQENPTVGGQRTLNMSAAESEFGTTNEFKNAKLALETAFKAQGHEVDFNEMSVIVSDDGKSFRFCYTEELSGDNNSLITVYEPYHGDVDIVDPDAKVNYDSNGNVESVTFTDPNTGKAQNAKLSTNDSAYDEFEYAKAMREYDREKVQYDREQNELNKKTSIYQRQDKQLEMKLKRLDTERNALNTEIDAVKKVIQDATDKGFKTFSG